MADLSLAIGHDPEPYSRSSGIPLVHTITVGNAGPDRATSIGVRVEFPDHLSPSFISDVRCRDFGAMITCFGIDLGAGESTVITTRSIVESKTDVMLMGSFSASFRCDLVPSNDTDSDLAHVVP